MYTDPFSSLLGFLINRHVELGVFLVSMDREFSPEVHVVGFVHRKRDYEKWTTVPRILLNPLCNRVDRLLAGVLVFRPVLPERLLEIQLEFLAFPVWDHSSQDRLRLGNQDLADDLGTMY